MHLGRDVCNPCTYPASKDIGEIQMVGTQTGISNWDVTTCIAVDNFMCFFPAIELQMLELLETPQITNKRCHSSQLTFPDSVPAEMSWQG